MFVYCTERLHLSEAEAYLRIAAARASRAHPGASGHAGRRRLHLTAVARLAPHLTVENRESLLARAVHRRSARSTSWSRRFSRRPTLRR